MKLVILSDTHNRHRRLRVPNGDVLVHCGDFTNTGSEAEIVDFDNWLGGLPHKHKLVIPGNHDLSFQSDLAAAVALLPSATVLNESGVDIDGVKFWGSPWTPEFRDWAFNYPPADAAMRWAKIPSDIDVLITHGPPYGIKDLAYRGDVPFGSVGCPELRRRVEEVKPRLHVFGHIHESPGAYLAHGTLFMNASMPGKNMKMDRHPHVFIIEPRKD